MLELPHEVLFENQFRPVIEYIRKHKSDYSRLKESVADDNNFFSACVHHAKRSNITPRFFFEIALATKRFDDVPGHHLATGIAWVPCLWHAKRNPARLKRRGYIDGQTGAPYIGVLFVLVGRLEVKEVIVRCFEFG